MMGLKNNWTRRTLWTLLILGISWTVNAAPLRDLCDIQGARGNMLKGIGLVVGLSGTGDKASAAIQAQQRMLERMDVDVQTLSELSSSNVAVVMVTATIPAFAKEGTRIDVKIDSLYDAQSLEGGQLMETHLRGPGTSDVVYAVAQGPISVGGFNIDGGGGTAMRRNHVTSALLPMGAYVEREVPSRITDGERLMLLLKQPDFTTADRIQQAITRAFPDGGAMALGAGTVRVDIPTSQQGNLVAFINQLMQIEVEAPMPTRVVINERTGTIVVGGNVGIKPCHVAHGNMTIQIAATPQVTQALPFTDADPVITDTIDLTLEEEDAYLMPVGGASAGEVAAALNRLRVTPRDMISIFQALRRGGYLDADLEIM